MSMTRKIFCVIILLSVVAIVISVTAVWGLRRISASTRQMEFADARSASLIRINRLNWERCAYALRTIINTDAAVINRLVNESYKATENQMAAEIESYGKNVPADAGDDVKRRPAEIKARWDALVAASAEVAQIAGINSNIQALALIESECSPLRAQEEGLFRTAFADAAGLRKVTVPMQSVPADIRELVLTSDPARGEEIRKQIDAKVKEADAALAALVAESKGSQAEWKALQDIWTKHKEVAGRIIALGLQNSNDRALAFFRDRVDPAQATLSAYCIDAAAAAQRTAHDLALETQRIEASVDLLITLTAAIGIVVSMVLAYFIISGIMRKLTGITDGLAEASTQVANAANAISGSSQGLAEGATEQAASLEETSSALEEMASMTRQNADNAARTSGTTDQTIKRIDDGSKAVGNMTGAMSEISDSAEQIGRIIKTIEEIAFQTNLLALNAAVEAARAGEAGKGFAVVADEVRNLAQRSAQAARDTASLIERTVARVQNGSEIASHLDASFREIDEGARNVGKLIVEITAATGEQAQGVDQVNTAVAQMDKVTQTNAASAEECASAAEQLSAQADALRTAVNDLGLMVVGRKVMARRAAAGMRPGSPSAGRARRTAPAAANQTPPRRRLPAPTSRKVMKPDEVIPLDDADGGFGDF